jgi:Putative auto-transporter adhesin, head GIN domain
MDAPILLDRKKLYHGQLAPRYEMNIIKLIDKVKEKSMKRTRVSLILLALFFIPSLACGSLTTDSVVGSGDIVTQTIDVSNFDRVTLEGFGDVYIQQGQTESLSVQTDDNIISLLEINVQGSELTLGMKRGYSVTPSQSITFNLTVQDLSAITLAGSGDFYVEALKSGSFAVSVRGSGDIEITSLTADDLSIELDGSGNITIEDVNVQTIETSLQGSGDIKLEGKADTQNVRVGGSGNYLAGDLEATSADISIPGSADVTVWASDELKVRVNGSGDIRYYGQPLIDQSGSGSGDLISLGEK